MHARTMRLLLVALSLSCGGSAPEGILCQVTFDSSRLRLPCVKTVLSSSTEGMFRAYFQLGRVVDAFLEIEVAFSGEMRIGTFTDADPGARSTITYDVGFREQS